MPIFKELVIKQQWLSFLMLVNVALQDQELLCTLLFMMSLLQELPKEFKISNLETLYNLPQNKDL